MAVQDRPILLTWERYALPQERWCLVENDSDYRLRMTHPYRTACKVLIDGSRSAIGRTTVVVAPFECKCKGVNRPHTHVDPWPPREKAGRIPLCLACADLVIRAGLEVV